MHCAGCGAENPDAGVFCFNCGNALTSPHAAVASIASYPIPGGSVQAAPSFPPTSPGQLTSEVERIRNEHPELIGIGGWLLWFCIVTTIIAPVVNVVSIMSKPSGYSIIDLALAVYMVITGVNLWRISTRALRLTKVLLAIQFWIGTFLFVIQIAASASGDTTSSSDAGGFRMLVGSIIWWFYFKKSKRVKATFGRAF